MWIREAPSACHCGDVPDGIECIQTFKSIHDVAGLAV